jgi:hypothetical protein
VCSSDLDSYKKATISFLAPPFDHKGTVDITRGDAIKMISGLTRILNKYIPGHIAKYEEDHEPRSFGDKFQRLGTSTILVESGGWKDDKEKQYIRKLNFILLLSAIDSIINKTYRDESFKIYDNLPYNKESLYDLVLRNLKFKEKNCESLIDIGINIDEIYGENPESFNTNSTIEELGDLSTNYGSDEIDLHGYDYELPGNCLKIGDGANLQIKKNGVLRYTIENGAIRNPLLH